MVKKKGLDRLHFGSLESPHEIQNKIIDRANEEYQRMVSLAESIDLGGSAIDWYQVALKLAKKYVPELKENKPRGPKVKWGVFEKQMLAGEIYRLKTGGCSIEQACEELAKMDTWKNFLDQKENTYDSDAKAALLKQGVKEEDLKALDKKVRKTVMEAADFAEESPEPDLSELYTNVLVEQY